MEKDTIYYRLKECAEMADIIEAAESGYVSLNRDDIRKLNDVLLGKINHALQMQEAIVKAQWELPLLLDRIKKEKIVLVTLSNPTCWL